MAQTLLGLREVQLLPLRKPAFHPFGSEQTSCTPNSFSGSASEEPSLTQCLFKPTAPFPNEFSYFSFLSISRTFCSAWFQVLCQLHAWHTLSLALGHAFFILCHVFKTRNLSFGCNSISQGFFPLFRHALCTYLQVMNRFSHIYILTVIVALPFRFRLRSPPELLL